MCIMPSGFLKLLATIMVPPCLRAGHSELRAAFFHNLDATKLILRRPMI